MSHHRSRRSSRHRRPAPPSLTRAQVRQQMNRLHVFCQLEALLELHKLEPDSAYLGQIDKKVGLLNQALDCLEQTV